MHYAAIYRLFFILTFYTLGALKYVNWIMSAARNEQETVKYNIS